MDEEKEILAGEYALGTLDATERAEAERLIASDSAFAARVRYWENRLAGLSEAVAPVEPASSLWPRILAALPASGGAQIIDLTRRLKRWQAAAYAAGAIAAALLVFVGVREAYQPRLPEGGKLVAVLQQDKVSPAFLLTVDLRTREFTVRRVGAEAPRDRSYELWLVHSKFPAPRSLGVIGDREFTTAALAAYDPQTINEATYAVSIEPPGGSPTGVATGPIVYVGKLIEATP
jgi:anti-sigma-K factor RskA